MRSQLTLRISAICRLTPFTTSRFGPCARQLLAVALTSLALANSLSCGGMPSTSLGRQVSVAGTVIDAKTLAPLPSAQALVELPDAEPVSTYTNAKGVFLAASTQTSASNGLGRLRIRAEGYEAVEAELDVQADQVIASPIALSSARPPALQQIQKSVDSGLKPSGLGAGWSDWYEVCLRDIPQNYRIVQTAFQLNGDRTCGDWSQCERISENCWHFRLQGHSEYFPPRPAFTRGLLTVTLRQQSHEQPAARGTVYIQYHSSWPSNQIDSLCTTLLAAGFNCVKPAALSAPIQGLVRYFRPDDKDLATSVRESVTTVLGLSAERVPLQANPSSLQVIAGVGQIELWLGAKQQ